MSRLLSLRQSVISSISCIPTEHLSLADSMFFGFSLIGVVGRGRRRTSPQLVYTILKAFSFLAVSKRLTYLEYNIVFSFVYHVPICILQLINYLYNDSKANK